MRVLKAGFLIVCVISSAFAQSPEEKRTRAREEERLGIQRPFVPVGGSSATSAQPSHTKKVTVSAALKEVSDLELELLEAGYVVNKDEPTRLKLIGNYKARLERLCPSGPDSLAERASAANLDTCADLVDKILDLDESDPDAICSKHGEQSEECTSLRPKDAGDDADVYTKLEALLDKPPAAITTSPKKDSKTGSVTVPASLRPLQDKIAEQSVELSRTGNMEVRTNLIQLYEEIIIKLCPNPSTALAQLERNGSASQPGESCLHYSKLLSALASDNLLPFCYTSGYQSSNCIDYINLNAIAKDHPYGNGDKSQERGLTRF